jgi:hypothetical protein
MSLVSPRIGFRMCKVRYASSQAGGNVNGMTYLSICTAGEITTKELFPASVRTGWISVISPILRILLAQEDIRHQCPGPCESREGFWVLGAPSGECQYWRRKRRDRKERDDEEEEEELSEMEVGGGVGEDDGDRDGVRNKARRKGKERRVETLGRRKVNGEVYRKSKDKDRQKASGEQWSR